MKKTPATTPIHAATQTLSDECYKALMRRKNDEEDNELQADKKKVVTPMIHHNASNNETQNGDLCVDNLPKAKNPMIS